VQGLNVHEILGILETEEVANRPFDVILTPPDDDGDVTDGDSGDEDDGLAQDPNHLGPGPLRQGAELILYDDDNEMMPDVCEVKTFLSISIPTGIYCLYKKCCFSNLSKNLEKSANNGVNNPLHFL